LLSSHFVVLMLPAERRVAQTEVGHVRVIRVALWALLLSGALIACGGGGGAEEPSAEGSSGSEDAAYAGPIASTDVARGQEVFAANCEDCHPGGEEDVGPSLIADPHVPADLRKQVREGSGKMRPFPEKRVSNEDLEALLAYLASINAVK
jgi:mono/diheme cytochrome c family protein